jgi:single-strand DNA-binding protein
MPKARSLNKVMLIGNLTRNPIIRDAGNGSIVATFGVATNSSWRDSSGNVQERTEFHNVVAWNKLAEICSQILSVGMLVYVEGEIRTRTWEDQQGGKRQQVEIKLIDMSLLDSKGKKGVGIDLARNAGSKLSGDALKSLPNEDEASAAAMHAEIVEPPHTLIIEDAPANDDKSLSGDDLF